MTGLKKCYVKNCENYGSFRFPSNDELRSKWVEAIKPKSNFDENNDMVQGVKASFLCRAHFEETDVKKAKDGRLKLRTSAIPSLKPTCPITQKINISKPPSQQKVHCENCRKVFTRKANLDKHLKGACGNVHCKEKHEHQIINIMFNSFEEGEAYMMAEELDSKFIRRSIKQSSSKDITSEPLTPGSPNKGTLAVYFECRQALKNRKTGTGSNCSAKLVLSSQISVKGKQEEIKHYRLKGCVTHGEGCGEEVGRMTKQQKKNITNLLKLGMSRAAVCNRYLDRDHFGGSFGKFESLKGKNKTSWISKIQRMNYPFPPDPDCNELEMVKRYCSMASVRCYNVGVPVQNLFGYHKKSKTPHFLMIFMEEWQREIFRNFSKSIIILCLPNIHSTNPYIFISILVLNNLGQSIPIMQAVSANNINTTLREMFETIVELEREACSDVKYIMSDQACFDEVQDCFCDIFTDNTTVNLTLSHEAYTDAYNQHIQVAFRMPCDRLDRVIFSIYETNLRYGLKEDKMSIGFYGNSKPWTIAEFERCHPANISFEISSQSKTSWSVTQSSWDVGDINTSHFVSFLEGEDTTICLKSSCQARCPKCPSTQLYCVHQFTCTCSEFTSKRFCTHIHVIIMNDLISKSNESEGQLEPNHSSDASTTAFKQDDHAKNGDISDNNDGHVEGKSIEPGLEASMKDNLESDPNFKLKEDAKSCLWSMIRYIDGLDDKASENNIKDICSKIIKTTKEILPKNMKMECKITRIPESKEVIDKINNLKKSSDDKECNFDSKQTETAAEFFIQKESERYDRNAQSGIIDGNKILQTTIKNSHDPCKLSNHEKQVLGAHRPRFRALRAAINADVWDFSWWILACSKPEDSLLILSKVFNSEERDKLLEKFRLAKTVWGCGICQNLSIDSILSGYIECSVCCAWFHRTCCNSDNLNDTFEDQFTCDKCTKFRNDQIPPDNVFTDVVSYIVTDVAY